jgi:high-affinity nickel-transport protein
VTRPPTRTKVPLTVSVRSLTRGLDGPQRWRLSGLVSAVAVLHVVAWGLFLYYARDHRALAGLGTLAYAFGLRHAFDVDHIAAIDNTTRKLLAEGQRPVGVGFFFSLGHASVVFGLTVALGVAAEGVASALPAMQGYGGDVGATVSGVFLCVIGVLNLIVLIDVLRIFRLMRGGEEDEARLEQRLNQRGFLARYLGRVMALVKRSWHMYPLGLLFGLGFDTATEVGLLAVAAGVATHHVPILAVLSLPLLFAAGMSLVDTADGAFMSHAYGWAFANPVRKIYYNLTMTGLSVVAALLIGLVELMQVLSSRLELSAGFWSWLNGLDFGVLGYGLVGLFVVTWALAVVVWKAGRIEQRYARAD